MGTIRLSDDFVSPAISKANPKITINQKPNQEITTEIERYWTTESHNTTFEVASVNLKQKLHIYIHSNTGYAHGQLSWTPNTFVNGGEIMGDITINVTDATNIPVSIPTGYEDYYLYDSGGKYYEDTNYDIYVGSENGLSGKVIVFDLNNYLSTTTNMCSFYYGKDITHLHVGNLNTSNITYQNGVFSSCTNLESIIGLDNWDTSKFTTMGGMFQYCLKLQCLDLHNFITGNVTSMSSMFAGCSNLKILDISGFNSNKLNASNLYYMFNCNSLQYLIIDSPSLQFELKNTNTNLNNSCKILVPEALIPTYQNATNWSAHSSQFKAIEDYDITRSNGQITVTPKNA